MRTLRRIAYAFGFRPQFGSIWFSPSLDFHYTFEDYAKELEEERQKNLTEREKDRRKNNWGGKF